MAMGCKAVPGLKDSEPKETRRKEMKKIIWDSGLQRRATAIEVITEGWPGFCPKLQFLTFGLDGSYLQQAELALEITEIYPVYQMTSISVANSESRGLS